MVYPLMIPVKRALLIGRDPNFAWALTKLLEEFHYSLEHVFTISEARTRCDRFTYDICFLDGLKEFEVDLFEQYRPSECMVFIVDANHDVALCERCHFLPKDFPVETMVSSLKSHLQK